MLFKTIASFLAIAAPLSATPAAVIDQLSQLPVYEGRELFVNDQIEVRVRVAMKTGFSEDLDVAKADFDISIKLMDKAKKVVDSLAQRCADEDVELSDSVLRFDPFTDEGVTCTRRLIEAVNQKFGSSVPTPVELRITEGGNVLIFAADIKGAEIVVPMRRT